MIVRCPNCRDGERRFECRRLLQEASLAQTLDEESSPCEGCGFYNWQDTMGDVEFHNCDYTLVYRPIDDGAGKRTIRGMDNRRFHLGDVLWAEVTVNPRPVDQD